MLGATYTHISRVCGIYTCGDVVEVCSVRVAEYKHVLGGIPRDRRRDRDGEEASCQSKKTVMQHA